MDHIDENLATSAENMSYSAAIHSVLAIGKRTLNHYYNKTDQSEIYRIAMVSCNFFESFLSFLMLNMYYLLVLHPRHKLQYFKNAGWEEEWIEAAEEIVHDEFDRTYAFMDVEVPSEGVDMVCFCIFYHQTLMYCFSRILHPPVSQRICSTIYLLSWRWLQLSYVANSIAISAQILNTSPTSSHGGMQDKPFILASTGWHLTI